MQQIGENFQQNVNNNSRTFVKYWAKQQGKENTTHHSRNIKNYVYGTTLKTRYLD